MAIRFTDGKLGMVFATTGEDHKKPNIIRGGSCGNGKIKSPINRNNTFETSFRQAISSNNNSVSYSNENCQFDSISTSLSGQLEDDGVHHEMFLSDESHQLIQPPEITSLSSQNNYDQLVHAAIQTESGNYIMVIRDNEIVGMHAQDDAQDTIVAENSEIMLHGTTECEVQSSNLADVCGDVCDQEITAQNIESNCETDDFFTDTGSPLDGHDNSLLVDPFEASSSPFGDDEQYVMVQLADGNNYLIPTSSLEGSSLVGSGYGGDQVFLNENGDHQIVQVLDSNPAHCNMQQNTQKLITAENSHPTTRKGRPRKRGYTQEVSVPISEQSKRFHISNTTNGSSNSKYLSKTTFRAIQEQAAARQVYPQQKPLPQSRSSASSSVKPKPPEDLKPRPFRFDMPEDEILTSDPSTDYLSLVIEQFQKENYK